MSVHGSCHHHSSRYYTARRQEYLESHAYDARLRAISYTMRFEHDFTLNTNPENPEIYVLKYFSVRVRRGRFPHHPVVGISLTLRRDDPYQELAKLLDDDRRQLSSAQPCKMAHPGISNLTSSKWRASGYDRTQNHKASSQ